MKEFFAPLGDLSEFNTLCEQIKMQRGAIHVVGAGENQKAHLIAALLEKTGKKGVVVSWSESAARSLYEGLSFFYNR